MLYSNSFKYIASIARYVASALLLMPAAVASYLAR